MALRITAPAVSSIRIRTQVRIHLCTITQRTHVRRVVLGSSKRTISSMSAK
jgi:hypothetical protein